MRTSIYTCLFALAMISSVCAHGQKETDPRVIAYFAGRVEQLDSIDVNKLTHLIFCFGHLNGNRYRLDQAKDTVMIRKMVSLKSKNPNLKVILSLGGWGGCETCSFAFSTDEGRQEFATEFKKLNDYFHTDGIDLDWEYPTIRLDNDVDKNPVHQAGPADRDNFTDLVRKLRIALGTKHELSFAAGGFDTYLTGSVDWAKVMPEVNYVNLMSYDIINGYSVETGHHTALYSTPKQKESTDNAVGYLLKIGVDPKKIIIGAAFYARVWEKVPAKDNGLYQPGKFKNAFNYSEFAKRLGPGSGYESFWDDTAKAPYSYNKKQKLFATYDDRRSMGEKTNYVISKGLGGIMFWELGADIYRGGLLDAITETIRQ
ncbi:MAG: glycoside hydrolase [Chitinophagaceae bacterium]|nr:MAG: glycoside hydrolase [Chitinophagaceae bacterium]